MIQSRRAFLATATFAAAALAVTAPAIAGKVNAGANGLAISGYDPVAYFTEDAAVPGKGEFTAAHEGATYRFSSAANRDRFLADPAKYTPEIRRLLRFRRLQGLYRAGRSGGFLGCR